MIQVEKLIDRVIIRVNINLKKFDFDVTPYSKAVIPLNHNRMTMLNAFYGISSRHPVYFNFTSCNLAGSSFLGKCVIDHSVLYKTDVRGDELKKKGETFNFQDIDMSIDDDEVIRICDSLLIKTLIHNSSHNPEAPEEFLIRNTVSGFYANIHGSPVEGCYLAPFSTVDRTTLHACIIGAFSYVQVGDLFDSRIPDGTIWFKDEDFEFKYTYSPEVLAKYIKNTSGERPTGILMDFAEKRKNIFQRHFDATNDRPSVLNEYALNPYAHVSVETTLSNTARISQRCYVENTWMGPGTTIEENSYIINSHLEKNNIAQHGSKIIHAWIGEKVSVGFNSFLRGKPGKSLTIGQGCMIMPHTIIDIEESLEISENLVVWGFIRNSSDLATNSLSHSDFENIDHDVTLGNMRFKGNGKALIQAFKRRTDDTLKAGSDFSDENEQKKSPNRKHPDISYNMIQPYRTGKNKGLYPSINIRP